MKKIYFLILMTLTIAYSHLSISSEDILENESVALESLAYQLRIDPWFLSKLKGTNSGELLKVYKRIIKKFEKIGSLEDLLVQVGHYCRIQAGHGECNFNGTGKFGDFLYILEDAVWKAKMIVVISQRSPERTDVSPKNRTMTSMRFPLKWVKWRSRYEKTLQRRTNNQSHQRA